MDEESIESNLATYKQQLSQIETVLQSAGTEGQEDLVQLRNDLTELVELTEASLLSVKKSKLLGFIDNLEASYSGSAPPQQSVNEIEGQDSPDDDDDDVEDDDEADEAALNAIIGTKCSIDYMPGWGPTQYCNAVILSVESLGETENDKGQVRVLFCNPTSNSMLPCPYFLNGDCRFDDKCRFSHGYIVNVEDIQGYRDPDFSLLTAGRRCLALQDDGLWHRGRIESADHEAHLYCVKILNETVTMPVDALFPLESIEESSDDEDPAHQHIDDDVPIGDGEWKATGATRALGDWEAHTKGIGSKLMAKMGYKLGDGLGKTNQGRLEPVEAVVLPRGISLDIIAELKKKNKLGIFNKTKKKKNIKRLGGRTGERKSRNVFDFLNKKLAGPKGGERMKIKKENTRQDTNRDDVKSRDKKNLNIQLVQIHQQMKELEREMSKLKKSRIRNAGTDRAMTAQIDDKMAATQQMMTSLKQQAKKIEGQQHSMKEHRKLTIF